jgi:hypothetical protein
MHAQRIVGPKRLQDFLQVRHGRVPDYLIRFDSIDVPGSPVITIRSSTSIIGLGVLENTRVRMMELGTTRMSSLTKSLQERIEELRLSIESQKAELVAYEKVLEVEVGREDPSADRQRITQQTDESQLEQRPATVIELAGDEGAMRLPTSGRAAGRNGEVEGSEAAAIPEFTGNKTEFVRAVVQARGSLGATPKEIDEVFKARQIERSRNLIYNALDVLLKQKKLKRENGRYFPPPTDAQGKPKSRISAEGLKRIREANKKRWAGERAAQTQATAAQRKSHTGKKAAPFRRAASKKAGEKRAAKKG